MFLSGFIRKYWFILPAVILFIIPFFWFAPNQMDYGGDANRLYFYDPISFIRSTASYVVGTEARGVVEPKYYYLPYVGMIALLRAIVKSPTLVVSIFNGIKLSIGYISVFFIVLELLRGFSVVSTTMKRYIASSVAGLLYIASFGTIHTAFYWDRALFTHDQIFLNPLMFYLILKFFLTDMYLYMYIALMVSFIFAANFGMAAVPALFAYYPIAILFIVLYVVLYQKRSFPWRKILVGSISFLGVHAFHLLGSIVNLLDAGSIVNTTVFDKKEILDGGVNYFTAVHSHGMVLLNILLPSISIVLRPMSVVWFAIVIAGFMAAKKNYRDYLLVLSLYLGIVFLVSANITISGIELYKRLFYIPGFSMFRVFFEKWIYVYIFFYVIVVGYSFLILLTRLKQKYMSMLSIIIFFIVIILGMPIYSGSLVHQVIRGSRDVQGALEMDPEYEHALQFMRGLPDDGKFLVLPLTDVFRQVVQGKNGGVYEGPSTLFHLTHKYGFVGYQGFGYKPSDLAPYAEQVLHFSKEKNYDGLLRIFRTLNIRYIFWNSNPKAYEESFINGSYGYVMTYLPKSQAEYAEYLLHFPLRSIYERGSYHIYQIDDVKSPSTIFIPSQLYVSSHLLYDAKYENAAFVSSNTCLKMSREFVCAQPYEQSRSEIQFTMVSPVEYKITLTNIDRNHDMLLVMQHIFHPGWNIYLGDKIIAKNAHFPINGYANGWIIHKEYFPFSDNAILYIRMNQQKCLYYGIFISGIFIFGIIMLIIWSLRHRITYE